MNTATRCGALLVKDVQKLLIAQQVLRASSGVRLGASWACRTEGRSTQASRRSYTAWNTQHSITARAFSTSAGRFEGPKKDEKDQPASDTTIHLQPPPQSDERTIHAEKPEPTISQGLPDQDAPPTPSEAASAPPPHTAAADEPLSTPASRSSALPSAFAHRRTEISRRMSHMMDNLLTKATAASQQINTYTGTDFSGIEALRNEIVAQEKQVKSSHAAVNTQKDRHMEAHVKQASSQKEIVSLLERKSNWSPSDLERYMTLVRSEHLDEQAVQKAKEDLANAERDLEDSRAMLEKLERKQYHEEQIWSDTIRRNSTWVTMGLMGLNIFLLLAQIIFFEPYRRRKIVREMKAALDEKSITAPGFVQTAAAAPEVVIQAEPAEKVNEVPVEVVETEAKAEPVLAAQQPDEIVAPVEAAPEPVQATPIAEAVVVGETLPTNDKAESVWKQLEQATSWEQRLDISKAFVHDLFSDRVVQLKQVDVTAIALQGAATGIATMGVLFLLLRPHSM